MTEFRVTNKNGVVIEVNENELYMIAEHWVDDCNEMEHEYAESNGEKLEERLWAYPNDFSQVTEILVEYMQCEVEELDNDDEIESDTVGLYQTLLA